MLSKSLCLMCLWFVNSMVKGQNSNCTVDGTETPETQTGINNYIIEELGTVLFPYATNQCTSTNVLASGKWYLFQCGMDSNGMSTVTKTEYLTEDCSGAGSVITVYNESGSTEGELGYFECSGSDTYAKIRLSLDSSCANTVTVFAALGACANMGGNSQMNFYCSATEAIAQFFSSNGMQMTSTFFPSTTGLLNATNLPTGLNLSMSTTGLFNATNLPTGLNQTILPTQFNGTILPTQFNGTILPTQFNATMLPTMFNATMFNATMPMLNMSTSQISIMMCMDDAFCDKWIFSSDCNLVTTSAFGGQAIYGSFDECSSGMASSTMISEFNTTFGENITVTGATGPSTSSTSASTSTSTSVSTQSGAIRPSLLFTTGVFFSFFFLVSV